MNEHNESLKTRPSSLPANRALVVQFCPAMADGRISFRGRLEHIASGRVEYFSSEQELRVAFDRLLSHG